jgi:hypothetical protein
MKLCNSLQLQLVQKIFRALNSQALVPDGRIFGQITQKRPQKIIYGRKKWQKMAKSSRKEAKIYFYKHLGEKSFDIM